MLKQGREIKTDISKLFRTSYGTVDTTTLKSIFINLSTWVEPVHEETNWERSVKKVKNKIKHSINDHLLETPFKNNTIVDLDLRSSGIKLGKRSFMRCEITLFLDNMKKLDIKSKEILLATNHLTNKVIEETLLITKTFKFHKSKGN